MSCVLGSAIMYFNWGPANVLRKAFIGIEAYQQRGRDTNDPGDRVRLGLVSDDKPGLAQDGFTLYTTTEGCSAKLIDMHGSVVHEWRLPFSEVWSNPPHVQRPLSDDKLYWFRSRLYPNGDLLALYFADSDTPHGYGMVKMDKNSRMIWKYANNTHHDFDIDENGNVYALTEHFHHEVADQPATIADDVVILSPDGQELERISLIDALANSPYALVLNSLDQTLDSGRRPERSGPMQLKAAPPPPAFNNARERGDLLHANSVKVLAHSLSPQFPFLKPGMLLVSLRNADALIVLDIESKRVVWAARGLWRAQHDPEFLANGHLLVFDNRGSPKGSRVLEFDPANNSYPWAYSSETSSPFFALIRGAKQRLSLGNTLVADPEGGRIFEVTLDQQIVWEYRCPNVISSFTRYPADTLHFLASGVNPRPQ